MTIKKFNPPDFYSMHDNKTLVEPTFAGRQLVIQYLNKKYQTNISEPIDDKDPQTPVTLHSDFLIKHLLQLKNKEGDHREAFVLQSDRHSSKHAVFLAYIKEGEKQGLLYSDTQRHQAQVFAQELNQKTGIKVFFTYTGRQADYHSCFTDSLVFGRDVTRKNATAGAYLYENLIHSLECREKKIHEGYSEAKLPNFLLKTAQLSDFVNLHKNVQSADETIHKNENLEKFRERYSEIRGDDDSSSYLQIKGNKYAKIMEIQFYINEIESNIERFLLDEELNVFISKAKSFMKNIELAKDNHDDLYNLAVDFLNEISTNTPSRQFKS